MTARKKTQAKRTGTGSSAGNGAGERATGGLLAAMLAQTGLTKKERNQLEREIREEVFESITKAEWIRMSGGSWKVLTDYCGRYGMPAGGAAISLPRMARWMHEFIAANKHKLAVEGNGQRSVVRDQIDEENLKMTRMKRMMLEGSLIPREDMRTLTTRLASLLRGAGERLQKAHGAPARAVLDEALDAYELELGELSPAPCENTE